MAAMALGVAGFKTATTPKLGVFKCGTSRHIRTNDPALTIIVFSAIALIFVSIFNSQSSPSPDQTLPESYMIETYDINP